MFHINELGYDLNQPKLFGIPVYEYYTTFGPRRLFKLYESKESHGIYINRFPKHDNGRRGTNHELYCDPDKVGCKVETESPMAILTDMVNCNVYPIDAPLSYSDAVRDNLQKDRIRFDGMSLFPEAINNDIRLKKASAEMYKHVYIPNTVRSYNYFPNMQQNSDMEFVYYNAWNDDWCNLHRDEILSYAREQAVAFREDATNADCRFARNRIRQAVFPEFARINPAFLQNLAGSMKHFAEAKAILDGDFAKRAPAFSHWEDDALAIDRKALLAEPFHHYWLFRSLEPFGFKPTQVDAVEASLVKGHCGSRFYSATHVALRDRAGLKIYPLVRPEKDEPPFCARIVERPADFDPRSVPAGTLCADADKLTLPLQFRRWQSGDRFRPLGMQGFRKLSDFFIDQKLDLEQKTRQVVVTTRTPEGRERIVAVAGLRIDDRVRVTEATRTLVWIEPSR